MSVTRKNPATPSPIGPKANAGWNSEFERVYVLTAARIRAELAAARIRSARRHMLATAPKRISRAR
jgi:hypothetical protein